MKTMQILFLNKDFFSKNYKILFLLFILFLIFYRSPYIFLNGRFIAEEGSFWFRNAFLFGPVKGITQIFVGSGYFNFWANISSVLATFLPLEYAPFATVYMAFLVQFYLFIFIIYSESTFLNNRILFFCIFSSIKMNLPKRNLHQKNIADYRTITKT